MQAPKTGPAHARTFSSWRRARGSRGFGSEIADVPPRRGSRLVLTVRAAGSEMSAAEKIETEMAKLHARTRRHETSFSDSPELTAEPRGW